MLQSTNTGSVTVPPQGEESRETATTETIASTRSRSSASVTAPTWIVQENSDLLDNNNSSTKEGTALSPLEVVAPPDEDDRSITGFKRQMDNLSSFFGGFKQQGQQVDALPNDSENPNLIGTIPEAVARPVDHRAKLVGWRSKCVGGVVLVSAVLIVLVLWIGGTLFPEGNSKSSTFVQFLHELTAKERAMSYGKCGSCLALSRDARVVAIGAHQATNEQGRTMAGRVEIFVNDQDQQWRQLGQIIDGSDEGDYFGDSVDLSEDGHTVAIGSVYSDQNNATQNVGHVEVHQYNETTRLWDQIGQSLYGGDKQDKFGEAVAISADGRKIAVGAVEESPGKAGWVRVYFYDEKTESWQRLGGDLVGLEISDRFGYALGFSADGLTVAVGGHANNGGTGYIRIFSFSQSLWEWKQLGRTIYGEGSSNSIVAFGISLALAGDGRTVAAGAPARWARDNSLGKVYVLEYINEEWVPKGQPLVGDHVNDNFGWTVSMSSDAKVLAVGANKHNGNGLVSGKATVYEFNRDKWTQISDDFAGDAANHTSFELAYGLTLSPDGNYLALQDDGGWRCDFNACNFTGRVRVFQKQ